MSTQAIRDVYLSHLTHLGNLIQSAETAKREAYNLKRTADLAYQTATEREEALKLERGRVLEDFRREFPGLNISVI